MREIGSRGEWVCDRIKQTENIDKWVGKQKGRMLNFFFFQAEDGIRDLVRSRGLGDVYKRQVYDRRPGGRPRRATHRPRAAPDGPARLPPPAVDLSLIHI